MIQKFYSTKIKWLGLGILFLAFLYILISFIIIPDMKQYSETKTKIELLKREIDDILQKKTDLSKSMGDFAGFEKNLMLAKNTISEKDIEKIIKKYGKNIDIKPQNSVKKDNLYIVLYKISMNIETPVKFYELIEDIKNRKLPLQIDYPVKFEKKDDEIRVEFILKVYSLSV
ncbi:hypothetical protein [Nitrosophilus alvini]|uniref:hypothetical protein n=1 Tax=Nitrosophilus alvini TaxID=2714855 RepID=UPI00190B7E26|nr:hypothetical protein [Nitrosophilus alvini]